MLFIANSIFATSLLAGFVDVLYFQGYTGLKMLCIANSIFTTFLRFFMEKQVMGEFARILRISRTPRVAFQLLQTMSIMIQNLKSENSICGFNLFDF